MAKRTQKFITLLSISAIISIPPIIGVDVCKADTINEHPNGIMDVIYRDYLSNINYIEMNSELAENELQEEKDYIESSKNVFNIVGEYYLQNQNGFKSFMSYRTITDKSSKQYQLKQMAETNNYGLRTINDRFCIAVGTGLNADVGTYIDVVLENGTIIPCIVSDIKDDRDTSADRITTSDNGCVSEFLVDLELLPYYIKNVMGNVSYIYSDWESSVTKFIIYDKSIL